MVLLRRSRSLRLDSHISKSQETDVQTRKWDYWFIAITSPGSRILLVIMARLVTHCFSVGTKAEEAKLHILGGYFAEAMEKSGNVSQPRARGS